MPSFTDRLRHGWNAFINNKDPSLQFQDYGAASYIRPDRNRFRPGNEKSIINSIFNRMAVDTAAINITHARLDENERFVEKIYSDLQEALNVSANIDQTGRALIQDAVMSMFDEGCVAIVPTDMKLDPTKSSSFDILELRCGKIIDWYPQHVKVNLYNEKKGIKEDILLPKKTVAIVENPFYSIMNEPNSTLKRLIRKLNLLDIVDEQSGADRLDLIVQLPYTIKTDARRAQAERRRKDIEMQLSSSKYGIAYTDGTERVTQLNRPVENTIVKSVEYFTNQLYAQLGLTAEILNGTASEEVMLNYYNRTIEPIISAITEEMTRKFLTKTARTQGQKIIFNRDPFKLVPVNSIADIADKFTRNEVLTSNEVRGLIGFKPVDDPRADELVNKNINHPEEESGIEEEIQNDEEEI